MKPADSLFIFWWLDTHINERFVRSNYLSFWSSLNYALNEVFTFLKLFMITSGLTASHECQIYGQSVKYSNQICLPELIQQKKKNKNLFFSIAKGYVMSLCQCERKHVVIKDKFANNLEDAWYMEVYGVLTLHCSMFFTFLIIGWYILVEQGSIKTSQSYSSDLGIEIQIAKCSKYTSDWNSLIYMQYIGWNLLCTTKSGMLLHAFNQHTLPFLYHSIFEALYCKH